MGICAFLWKSIGLRQRKVYTVTRCFLDLKVVQEEK